MSSTYRNLQELRDSIDLKVEGLENYPKDGPSIIIANHSCLKDIFYLPAIIPEETISLISSRIIFKNNQSRKALVEKYLNAMPIEAHGGPMYIDACLNAASKLLKEKISLSIFPEGAYVFDQSVIYRGRTGAARLMVAGYELHENVHLLPVAINYESLPSDLDSYDLQPESITLTILDPVDCQNEIVKFLASKSRIGKNMYLHEIVDKAMSSIAMHLSKEYSSQYIELYPKGNVMFPDGSTISVAEAHDYLYDFQTSINERGQKLVRKIKGRETK